MAAAGPPPIGQGSASSAPDPQASASAARWSDLKPRLISGLILGAIAGLCLWLGGYWNAALTSLAAAAMAWEYRRIVFAAGVPSAPPSGRISDLAFIALAAAVPMLAHMAQNYWGSLGLTGIAALGFYWLDGHRGRWTMPGLLMIGAATAAFVTLRDQPRFGLETTLWLVGVVVASDVGGYFAGRLFGGPKLAPKLSPKKTWSGLLGSIGLAFLVGGLFSWATTGTYAEEVCTVSAIAALVAVAGDLAESRLKRRFRVKDTSNLLPGHGGALDRLDGLMSATLVAAAITFARGQEVFIW
ncbi:MAG: phosphatidate cytidylyltransferase [Neomegalonema sp.]|nr:phosphatidate cytidylyltransferase [Neomegalonema sp.]